MSFFNHTGKKRSVQTTLQYVFFFLIFVIFLAYISYFAVSESRKIKSRAFDAIGNDVVTTAAFTDEDIKSINTVMQNVAYSNLVKEHFLEYLNRPASDTKNGYTSIKNIEVLTDLLTAIIGPSRPVDQIYLYALDEGYVGVGLDNSNSNGSVRDMPWYNDLMNSDNNRIMFCDTDKRLEKYFTYSEGSQFITVCSTYLSTFYSPQGVVEIKHSISSLISKLKNIDTGTYNERIYIYDPNGNIIYNSSEDPHGYEYYKAVSSADIPDDVLQHIDHGNSTHLFAQVSSYSGFTTVIATDNRDLYRPIYDFIKAYVFIFLGFAVLVLILSYAVSRIITIPVMKMYTQISGLHTEEELFLEGKLDRIDTNIIELDTLYSAVVAMHERAQSSAKREIALNNQRLQSQILALQSQMNPHFLYNSLATIQAMADEGMNDEVVTMCHTISRILRYISSNKEPLVNISEDTAHARDYLECMKMRYGDDLIYEIEVPEEMMNIKIPKLCLQLIVENSIKFATKSVKPPWRIKISGKVTGIYWEISVKDNGTGFSEDDINAINEKTKIINETELLPDLEINGMGLMNIYIRFKTLYHGKHIFRISNAAEGGAIVTIGGEHADDTEDAAESVKNG